MRVSVNSDALFLCFKSAKRDKSGCYLSGSEEDPVKKSLIYGQVEKGQKPPHLHRSEVNCDEITF